MLASSLVLITCIHEAIVIKVNLNWRKKNYFPCKLKGAVICSVLFTYCQGQGNDILTNITKGKFPHNPLPLFIHFLPTPLYLRERKKYTSIYFKRFRDFFVELIVTMLPLTYSSYCEKKKFFDNVNSLHFQERIWKPLKTFNKTVIVINRYSINCSENYKSLLQNSKINFRMQ